MNLVSKVAVTLQAVIQHPVNRHRKLKALFEYPFIQIAARLVPGHVCVEFPNRTLLLVSPRMKGAAHYITPRLFEFENMAFVMHFLRPTDLFVDVGANIGAFTIMAAGAVGARTVTFEASPDTYAMLASNIRLNGVQDRARALNCAAGRSEGTTQFSVGLGTENFVVTNGNAGAVTVKMTTLDKELAGSSPDLLKVDVEGFEVEVFAGATKTLRDPKLRAIIVERKDISLRYGFDENKLHQEIRECGFLSCSYRPFDRELVQISDDARGDIIYVRDISAANALLRSAPPFSLGNFSV